MLAATNIRTLKLKRELPTYYVITVDDQNTNLGPI